MKNKTIVGIFALYIMAIGFSWLSTYMFDTDMDEDASKIEARMSQDGVPHSPSMQLVKL